MLLSFAIWMLEAVAAAAISVVATGVAVFIGLVLWLQGPLARHEANAQELQPLFAVDDHAKEG